MNRLFGTDGIRGRALEPPLDEPTVRRLGVALAELLAHRRNLPRVLLAGDTRASTETLARWFGIPEPDLDVVAPNLANFTLRDLGFMRP